MSTAGQETGAEVGASRRLATPVAHLDGFVGAHPSALERIYLGARPADPGELGASPRGRLLAVAPLSRVFLMVRPVMRALATDLLPWQGKVFDHGGNSGQNRVLGGKAFRFRAEVAASRVDGKPALVLRYGDPAYRNPWPVRAVTDELRCVGTGVAIGPAYFDDELVLWWGLEAAR